MTSSAGLSQLKGRLIARAKTIELADYLRVALTIGDHVFFFSFKSFAGGTWSVFCPGVYESCSCAGSGSVAGLGRWLLLLVSITDTLRQLLRQLFRQLLLTANILTVLCKDLYILL